MSLNKIKVKNFQSIPEAEVELGSFTVFTGPTDSGKSAFMRATEGAVRNKVVPAHVRRGKKATNITLEFNDHVVEVERGKSKSTYKLDGESFTKSGTTVPDEVAQAIRLPKIMDVETTFSSQFDKPYLISETGSSAAKVLGSLTNVSVLHSGIKEAHRRWLADGTAIKATKENIEECDEHLEQYEGLDDFESGVANLSGIVESLDEQYQSIRKLSEVLNSIENKTKQLKDAEFRIVDTETAEECIGEARELSSRISSLSVILSKVSKAVEEYNELSFYAGIEEFDRISEISALFDRMGLLQSLTDAIKRKARELKNSKKAIEESDRLAVEAEENFHSLLDELGTCPTCGQELP